MKKSTHACTDIHARANSHPDTHTNLRHPWCDFPRPTRFRAPTSFTRSNPGARHRSLYARTPPGNVDLCLPKEGTANGFDVTFDMQK